MEPPNSKGFNTHNNLWINYPREGVVPVTPPQILYWRIKMQTNAQRQAKYRAEHLDECRERERSCTQRQRDNASPEWTRRQSWLAVGRVYKYRYGLTRERYEAKLASQNNLCGMCHKPFDFSQRATSPALDHNHKTKQLRDFVHHRCNLALGHLLESVDNARFAAEYLEKHQEGLCRTQRNASTGRTSTLLR